MKPAHLVLMVVINIVWGFNIVPMKLAVEHLPPVTATVLRFAFVALICAPFIRWEAGRMAPVFVVSLIGGALQFTLNNMAFAMVEDVSVLAIAGQLGVPFALLLAIAFLHERIRLVRTIGIVLSFTGIAILSFDPHVFDQRVALMLSVAAAFFYASGTVMMRQLKGFGPLQMQGWVALISLPPMIGLSMTLEPGALAALPAAPPAALGYVLFTAVGASIVGHAGLFWLLQRYPVSVTAPYTMLAPILSVGFSVWLLDSRLTLQMVLGAIVALAGVGIITVRTAQKSSHAISKLET